MKSRAALLALILVAIPLAEAQGKVLGDHAATTAVMAHVKNRFPTAHTHFVNCPGNNRIDLPDGSEGLACEFRVVSHHATIIGSAGVAPVNRRRFAVVGFHAGRPAPRRWKGCGVRKLEGLPSSEPRTLAVYGTTCPNAQLMAGTIQFEAESAGNLRIRHHFIAAQYGTDTLGFETNTFRCRGRVTVRQGNPNPYGHEVARCRTRFGDRFLYSFDIGN